MKRIAFYHSATGRVQSIMRVPDAVAANLVATEDHDGLRAVTCGEHKDPMAIKVVAGRVVATPPVADMEKLRSRARTRLEQEFAGALRGIVGHAGRAAIHARKAAAARQATSSADGAALLALEALERRVSTADMAALVLAKATAQDAALHDIDSRRRDAKAAIKAATTPQQLDAALDAAGFSTCPDDLKFHCAGDKNDA